MNRLVLFCYAVEENRHTIDIQIVINLFIFIITEILLYQKAFFHGSFTIGSKNFLGYTENYVDHPLDFKETIKKKFALGR